jgi:hypothetical protein
MDLFDYPANHNPFELKLIKSSRQWRHYSVSFPTALPTMYPELGIARGEYYEPVAQDAPLVILLHGMGNRSTIPCKALAASLAQRGIGSFVPYLPVHTSRLTADMKHRYPRFTDDEWAEIYRVSVVNIRQIIDWADKQSGTGKRQIGILGISFGGFISAITMGIDERVKSGVLIVMGGNSAKIGQWSRRWSTRYGLPTDEYHRALAVYDKYLEEVAQKGLANVPAPVPSFTTDPLTYSGLLKHRPLYMINARWDEAIPRASTLDFWKATGEPAITWLPASHASVWLYYPLLRRRIDRFFHQSLHQNQE